MRPVALVTGGARMGREVALALVDRGYDIAFSAHRSRAKLDEVSSLVGEHGGAANVFEVDLSDRAACQALVDDVVAWRGRLDLFVGLASVYERMGFDALTPAAWRHQLAVDLDASFHCAQASAAVMRAHGTGHIILSADWVAASGRPRYDGYVPYYVAKACVIALTEALALELAESGIRVNAVAPGPILPAAGVSADQQAAVIAATPLGHWGTPDAIAHTIGGLVDAATITGQVVRVDGGRHLR